MEPVFMLDIFSDGPVKRSLYCGFSQDRQIETDTVPIVTGHEELEICYSLDLKDAIVIETDGFIRDSQGQPIGVYLRAYYENQKTDYGRYELLLDQTLTVTLPEFIMSVIGEEEDISNYKFTLRAYHS